MTVSRLSVLTAYVTFAFVGAIVLGVFGDLNSIPRHDARRYITAGHFHF